MGVLPMSLSRVGRPAQTKIRHAASSAYLQTGIQVRPSRPINDDYGVITLCASMAREFSQESKQLRNGYFTRALVEGLDGKADYNQSFGPQCNPKHFNVAA